VLLIPVAALGLLILTFNLVAEASPRRCESFCSIKAERLDI